MRTSFVLSLTILAGLTGADSIGGITSPEGKTLTRDQRAALDRGEILVHLATVSGTAVKKATAVALVDAEPERVFAVLTDYPSFVHFMPYCRKVEVQRSEGEKSWVRFELDFPWPIGDRHYVLCLTDQTETVADQTVRTSRWTYDPDSGNINDTYGSWEVWPYKEDKAFVRYTVFTDPGGRVPGWAANMATDVAVPNVIEGLRDRVRDIGMTKPKTGSGPSNEENEGRRN